MLKDSESWVLYGPIFGIALISSAVVAYFVLNSRYPDIAVADQQVAGQRVAVEKVFLKSDGFVAIHESDAGGALVPVPSIGETALDSGLNLNVVVELSRPVTAGSKLFAVVHQDTGMSGKYEYGVGATNKDPVVHVDGEPVAASFYIN